MNKVFLGELEQYVYAYLDDQTGIVWVENGKLGIGHSAHPNIDETGSLEGMANRYPSWRNARIVHSHGWYYNTSVCVAEDQYDKWAAEHCWCGGEHGAHQPQGYPNLYQAEMSHGRRVGFISEPCPSPLLSFRQYTLHTLFRQPRFLKRRAVPRGEPPNFSSGFTIGFDNVVIRTKRVSLPEKDTVGLSISTCFRQMAGGRVNPELVSLVAGLVGAVDRDGLERMVYSYRDSQGWDDWTEDLFWSFYDSGKVILLRRWNSSFSYRIDGGRVWASTLGEAFDKFKEERAE